jgi:hypothetical protein
VLDDGHGDGRRTRTDLVAHMQSLGRSSCAAASANRQFVIASASAFAGQSRADSASSPSRQPPTCRHAVPLAAAESEGRTRKRLPQVRAEQRGQDDRREGTPGKRRQSRLASTRVGAALLGYAGLAA